MSLKTSLESGFIIKPQGVNLSQNPTTISSEETKEAVRIYEKTQETAHLMALMPLTGRHISISIREAKEINDWMTTRQKRFDIDDAIARMNNEPGMRMDHKITNHTL